MNDQSTPTLASLSGIAHTGAGAVNSTAGLPGPARLTPRAVSRNLP